MIILIDFDRTLMDPDNIPVGHRMGPPEAGAIVAMQRLSITNELIVFTGRKVNIPSVYDTVAKWMDYFHIPYNAITNVKPERYDLIIDDKAIHFDTWTQVLFRLDKNLWR